MPIFRESLQGSNVFLSYFLLRDVFIAVIRDCHVACAHIFHCDHDQCAGANPPFGNETVKFTSHSNKVKTDNGIHLYDGIEMRVGKGAALSYQMAALIRLPFAGSPC